jgi:Mg2+/Co2+ transporter CorC
MTALKFDIKEFMRAVVFVPESKTPERAAARDSAARACTWAVVADEYGGIAGS